MVALTLFAVSLIGLAAQPASRSSYQQRLDDWRKARVVEAAGPEGWTTVVALHWLQPGVTRVGSAEGVDARLPRQRQESSAQFGG